jgi:hypothetical protein
MAKLTDLPNELLEQICLYVGPGDLFHVTLACKALQRNCGKALDRHELRILKYTEIDDRNGMTMPRLLCDVLDDRSLGWYVRKAVIWMDRGRFSKWTAPRMDRLTLSETRNLIWRDLMGRDDSAGEEDGWETTDDGDADEDYGNVSSGSWETADSDDGSSNQSPAGDEEEPGEPSTASNQASPSHPESRPSKLALLRAAEDPEELVQTILTAYALRIKDFLVREAGIEDLEVLDQWFSLLREGCDQPVKALLIALCPRLRTLVLVQQPLRDGVGPLDLFQYIVRWRNKSPQGTVSPILSRLEHLYLQYQISTEWDGFGEFSCDLASAVQFCTLPTLKTLSIHELDDDTGNMLPFRRTKPTIFERLGMDPFESDVEHVFLDFISPQTPPETLVNFMRLFRGLKSFRCVPLITTRV